MDTLSILIVDDEPGMLSGAERVLQNLTVSLPDVQFEACFSTKTAANGEDALDIIKASPPDILLLDYKLPGLSGLDVLERLGTDGGGILTIMVTAYASLETAVTAIKQGAYDFLAKPFTPVELKAVVRKATQSLIHARHARNLARERRQVRFQFISVLAHELKSPISAVEGYLNVVQSRTAGDNLADYDGMLNRCVVRLDGMRKMITDLLDMTYIESGQKKRELFEVDVYEVASNCVENIIPQAALRGIIVDLHGGSPIKMLADRSEIEIVMNNLVSNAVKYNRDGGRVDISLACQDEHIKITVSDTGIGIAKEDSARLFSDFVRIKNAATRNVLGSGLGLSIVKKIAYLYDGSVGVESAPGKGSKFTVVLGSGKKSKRQ